MADACHRIERSTDGLDHTLQSMCVSKTNRKKRTHRVWVDVSIRLLDRDRDRAFVL